MVSSTVDFVYVIHSSVIPEDCWCIFIKVMLVDDRKSRLTVFYILYPVLHVLNCIILNVEHENRAQNENKRLILQITCT